MTKSGFDATLRRVRRDLRAQDRRIARYQREGRWPTEEQMHQLLARTPTVRPRGNWDAFWQQLAADDSVRAAGGLPALRDPMLVALGVRCLTDGKRPPFFRRLARDFLELLRWRLYLMPLAPMPRGMRSGQALNVDTRIPRKRDRDRRARCLRAVLPERARAVAAVEKKRRQSWPAHAELVFQVRLLTGRLFFRELAVLITAAHHAHGNPGYHLGAGALAKAYRRWLKGSPGGQR